MIPVPGASSGGGDGPDDRLAALRSVFLQLAQQRFGPLPRGVKAHIRRITNVAVLEQLLQRVITATNWQEVLAEQE